MEEVQKTIEKVVQRGENLTSLHERAEKLTEETFLFNKNAIKVKRKTRCENWKMMLIILIVILLPLLVVIVYEESSTDSTAVDHLDVPESSTTKSHLELNRSFKALLSSDLP